MPKPQDFPDLIQKPCLRIGAKPLPRTPWRLCRFQYDPPCQRNLLWTKEKATS